jgi:uncharacterized protein (TIGR03067 family)
LRGVDKETAETDREKLQGDWELVRLEANGQQIRGDMFAGMGNLTVEGDRLFSPDRDPLESAWKGTFKLDPTQKLKRITIFDKRLTGNREFRGIYSVDRDELRICIKEDGTNKAIPTDFKTKPGSPFIFATFRRMKVEKSWAINQSSQSPPPMEKSFKQYQIECTLVKVDPKGKDLGEDGNGKVLALPSLLLREGSEQSLHSGGALAYGDEGYNGEFLQSGVLARLKVTGLKDGRVRLEAQLEEIDIDQTGKDAQACGRFVRIIAKPKLGESVKLVEKDERGEPRHWLRIKVVKEETVDVTTRYVEPAHQGK